MNKHLPLWHTEYLQHIHYWNSSFTNETEPMKIQFIPMNNKYMVKDHVDILKKLKERLINHNPDYSINLLNRTEGGFQLKNKNYQYIPKSGDTNLQIRCNIYKNSQPYFLENKANNYYELIPYPDPFNRSGLKIFEFVAYKNVPKKTSDDSK